ncbi:MAG: diadenylate cyclase CdaA [Saprospiraceae bacterium]
MIFLFKIGFLPISLWDVLDIVIVGYLIYRIYLLLKGSIAFNILVGVLILYVVWWLVGLLKMDMLSLLLNRFVNVGFIIIIIIFQPEVRRFFLLLGSTTLGRRSNFFSRWLAKNVNQKVDHSSDILEIKSAILRMSREKIGALIVFSKNLDIGNIGHSGTLLHAQISHSLLLSIFQKESPLHDGAVVIGQGKILTAGCILPVSESSALPASAGLRHRAGLGISERTTAAAFIVSEETGAVSFTAKGRIEMSLTEARLNEALFEQYE